jgi:hypothetical protein
MTTDAANGPVGRPEARSTNPVGDENDAMVRTVVARRYRVLELLGRGGMGSV